MALLGVIMHDLLMSNFQYQTAGVGALAEAWGKACPYCDVPMDCEPRRPTRDHILPRCRGGSRSGAANILIVCYACNHDKGDKTLMEFLSAMALRLDPRASVLSRLVASFYANLDVREANALVAAPRSEVFARCLFPKCQCVGSCEK